jgi:hypothetical protein
MIRISEKKIKSRSFNLLVWLIGFGWGALLSFGVAFKAGFSMLVVKNPYSTLLIWFLAILAMILFFTLLIKSLIFAFQKKPDFSKIGKSYLVLMSLYTFLFVLLALFRKTSVFATFSSLWITGRRGLIINFASLSFLGFLLPLILTNYLILFESEAQPGPFGLVLTRLRLLSKNLRKPYDHTHLPFYDGLFMLIFLGLCLLPLFRATNLMNIGSDFLARKWLLDFYANTRFDLGDRIFNLSISSSDHWLVYTGESSLDDYQNTVPFTEDEVITIQRKLDRLDRLLASKGIKLLVVIPPNKNTIYPEYVPAEIPIIGSQSRLDQIISYEQNHDTFKIMDLRPLLLEARVQKQVYYPCDTHWNPYGAFIAYRAILMELQKQFPVLKPHSLNEYSLVPDQTPCDISSMAYIHDLPSDKFSLSPQFSLQLHEQDWQRGIDQGSFFVRFPYANITVFNADPSLPRLLMFRDSFGAALIPFLEDHFSRSVYLWAYPADEAYYDTEKPDIVIIEFTERYLNFLIQIPG